jgi:hypothetical protein
VQVAPTRKDINYDLPQIQLKAWVSMMGWPRHHLGRPFERAAEYPQNSGTAMFLTTEKNIQLGYWVRKQRTTYKLNSTRKDIAYDL